MKIKLEIPKHDDLADLIRIFGMNGMKVWREQEQTEYRWEDKKQYLMMEIDDESICKEEE